MSHFSALSGAATFARSLRSLPQFFSFSFSFFLFFFSFFFLPWTRGTEYLPFVTYRLLVIILRYLLLEGGKKLITEIVSLYQKWTRKWKLLIQSPLCWMILRHPRDEFSNRQVCYGCLLVFYKTTLNNSSSLIISLLVEGVERGGVYALAYPGGHGQGHWFNDAGAA